MPAEFIERTCFLFSNYALSGAREKIIKVCKYLYTGSPITERWSLWQAFYPQEGMPLYVSMAFK